MQFRFLGLLSFLGAFAFVGTAADVTGKWTVDIPAHGLDAVVGNGGGSNVVPLFGSPASQSVITLQANGSNLTGSLATARGDFPISEGKIAGNNISFKIIQKQGGDQFITRFKGKVKGDTIAFTRSIEHGPTLKNWTAKRQ